MLQHLEFSKKEILTGVWGSVTFLFFINLSLILVLQLCADGRMLSVQKIWNCKQADAVVAMFHLNLPKWNFYF